MKATITFTDTPEGTVSVTMDFDPPVTKKTESQAQAMACRALDSIKQCFEHEDEEYE